LELKNGPIDFLKPLSVVDSRLVLTSASKSAFCWKDSLWQDKKTKYLNIFIEKLSE
jgi:hypothetical protein